MLSILFLCWSIHDSKQLLYSRCHKHVLSRKRGKEQMERWRDHRNLSPKRLPGLPWRRSGWESACQCRGHGFEPWSGKIPHAAEQLGQWATITEPVCLEPVLCNKRGRDSEGPAHHDEEWPPLAATRESPRTETKTQHSNQSINQSNFKKKLPINFFYFLRKWKKIYIVRVFISAY